MQMLKILSALALFNTCVQGKITNITNQCDFNGMVETSFHYSAPPNNFLHNVRVGRCSNTSINSNLTNVQIDVHAHPDIANTYEYKIIYNAKNCAEEKDYLSNGESLPANSTIKILIDDVIGSRPRVESINIKPMILRTHTITSRCGYSDNYIVATFDFGHINQQVNNDATMDTGVLRFGMDIYKDVERTEPYAPNENFYSGQMAFINVYVIEGSMPGGNGQSVWAPTRCVFSEIGEGFNKYTLFPYQDTCGGVFANQLNFDIKRESNGSWLFQYRLFVFKDAEITNYRLECDISLCRTGEQNNACTDMGDLCQTSFAELVRS